jgi:hypothetical protein
MAKVYVLKRPMKMVVYPNEGYIFIPIQQIVDLLKRKIIYPNCEVMFEENQIVVRVWKEEKPKTLPLTTLKQ